VGREEQRRGAYEHRRGAPELHLLGGRLRAAAGGAVVALLEALVAREGAQARAQVDGGGRACAQLPLDGQPHRGSAPHAQPPHHARGPLPLALTLPLLFTCRSLLITILDRLFCTWRCNSSILKNNF
jgi:hypothetical protein